MLEEFLTCMKGQGWNIKLNEGRETHLSKIIGEKYTNLPQQWLDFISTVKSIKNNDDTTWFLCKDDFDVQEEDAFQWNEWELVSLESAEGDGERETEINKFWNNHLPIIMSVKGSYSYYAISIKNGSIVQGAEPEFEECEIVANSFEELLRKIINNKILL